MIVFVGALAAGATGAFFSDTETSTGNTFAAGSLDLRVDSEAHYNGSVCTLDDHDDNDQTPDTYR
jgi:predicted ribosomally synthesized peptide with SipW-like signal peptide